MTASDPVLETRDVSYRRNGDALVQRVSISAGHGELLALCGPHGAGHTTLLRILAGDVEPDNGAVHRCCAPSVTAAGAQASLDALARDAVSVLLLEEPTRGADPRHHDEIVACCRARAEDGATVVFTSHDLALVARHARTAALLVAGRLVSWAVPAVAFVPAVRLLGYGSALHAMSGPDHLQAVLSA